MIIIKEQTVKELDIENLLIDNDGLIISNSFVETLNLQFHRFKSFVKIENCIINQLNIHSCWFTEGLSLENNIILSPIDYQMGGHNKKPIVVTNNIFGGFFNFFDCHFEDIVTIEGNVFKDGSNILGNIDKGFKNTFEKNFFVRNNIGEINQNRIL